MKKFLTNLILILLFIGFSQFAFSQIVSRFSYEQFVGEKGDTLLYRQLYPDASALRKYPLVIFLHGAGERGSDNEAQLKWGVGNFATDQNMLHYPSIVIAPQCPKGISWSNYSRGDNNQMRLLPSASKPMELLIALIPELIKTLPIDPNRIYITGLSMGGYGTFDALQRYPNMFAAAVPVCGAGDVSKAASIAKIPIWIFNGAEDPTVDPIHSINMFNELTNAGGYPGFTQYPEVGHFSWLGAYSDPLMMQWLFRQHK